MQKLIAMSVVLGSLIFLSGCTMTLTPIYGSLYTNAKGPVAGVDNAAKDAKKGTAVATCIAGVAYGDSSISQAMKVGNINKVHHVDCEVFTVMGVYSKFTTVVYGE